MIKNLILQFLSRLRIIKSHKYMIGSTCIYLPRGHMLSVYQGVYRNYDKKLPIVAGLVAKKYPNSVVVDVGANVGDTAAAMRSVISNPILCVEGNSKFLPYLKRNIELMSGVNRVVPMFIRPDNFAAGSDFRIESINGTARLLRNGVGGNSGFVNSSIAFKDMLSANSDMGVVKLIKSDTDGFDFSILSSALGVLESIRPVLFFEFDPLIGESTPDAADSLVEGLIAAGYKFVVVYDNYGNYLISGELNLSLTVALVVNLVQRKRAGGGASYFDFCCFSFDDFDLFNELVQLEMDVFG